MSPSANGRCTKSQILQDHLRKSKEREKEGPGFPGLRNREVTGGKAGYKTGGEWGWREIRPAGDPGVYRGKGSAEEKD